MEWMGRNQAIDLGIKKGKADPSQAIAKIDGFISHYPKVLVDRQLTDSKSIPVIVSQWRQIAKC